MVHKTKSSAHSNMLIVIEVLCELGGIVLSEIMKSGNEQENCVVSQPAREVQSPVEEHRKPSRKENIKPSTI